MIITAAAGSWLGFGAMRGQGQGQGQGQARLYSKLVGVYKSIVGK